MRNVIDTTAGAGDTGKAGGDKINAMTAELYGSIYGNRPLIAHCGDSIGAMFWDPSDSRSPLFWGLGTYPADLAYDARLGTAGGGNISISGSPSSSLITSYNSAPPQIQTLLALNPIPDIVFVQTLQNDFISNSTNAATFAANVTSFITQALAGGVKTVVTTGRPPKTESGFDIPRAIDECNRIIRQFCNATKGAFYLDFHPTLRDRTGSNDNLGSPSTPWRGTSGSTNGYSAEGTHPTQLAGFAVEPIVSSLMQAIGVPRMYPRVDSFCLFDPTNFPYGNVLGPNGMMIGTGGSYNGSANANVVGAAGGSYPNSVTAWSVTDGTGIIATPSIVTGTDGYLRQRLTFSGTATAATDITFKMTWYYGLAAQQLTQEAVLDFTAMAGLSSVGMASNGSSGDIGLTAPNPVILPTFTRSMLLRNRRKITGAGSSSGAGNTTTITFSFANGVSPSGTVDIGRVGYYKDAL